LGLHAIDDGGSEVRVTRVSATQHAKLGLAHQTGPKAAGLGCTEEGAHLRPRRIGVPDAQTLEGIDICIALKQVQQPSIAAFLEKY
jgi:hypothetical protein